MVVSSKFNPFSLERLLQPLVAYGQLYNKTMDAYDELASQAEVLKLKAAQDPNSLWALRYNAYNDMLEQSSNDILTNGLAMDTRRKLSQAKKGYVSSVKSAADAIAQLQKIADSQYAQNPALRMEFSAMPTIDLLIGNMEMKPKAYSGAAVEQSAMLLAAKASERRTTDSFNRFRDIWMKKRDTVGYSDDDIANFMQNADVIPELKAIKDLILGQFNNFDGLSELQLAKMAQEIINGILKGASYKENVDYKHDPLALYKAQQQPTLYVPTTLRGNPYDLANPVELTTGETQHRKYSKYFNPVTGELTDEGWEEYKRSNANSGQALMAGFTPRGSLIDRDTDFKKFAVALNGGKPIESKELIQKLYKENEKRLKENNKLNGDIIIHKAFDVNLGDLGAVRQALELNNNKNAEWKYLPTYKYGKNGYLYDEDINFNDSEFDDASFAGEYGVQGNYVVISTKSGNQYRVPLREINPSLNSRLEARFMAIREAYKDYEELFKKQYPDKDKKSPEYYAFMKLPLIVGDKGMMSYQDEINNFINQSLDDYVLSFQLAKAKDYTTQ